MLESIRTHGTLNKYITEECEENGVSVTIDEGISSDKVVIVKVDSYYNDPSNGIHPQPPSIDGIITLDKSNSTYSLYLIELKSIKRMSGFKVSNIEEKFKTTINDFMTVRFKEIYEKPNFRYDKIKLYFVTDPLKFVAQGITTTEEIRKKITGTKLEKILLIKPLKFRNKICSIEYKIPNPMIKL